MDFFHGDLDVLSMVLEPKEGEDPETGRVKTDEVCDLGLFSPKSKCHDQDCKN